MGINYPINPQFIIYPGAKASLPNDNAAAQQRCHLA